MGKYDNITRIVVGGTDINRVMYMGEQIWPRNVWYAIVLETIQVKYSSGNQILANASNYGYITATVETYRGQTKISTQENVQLTINSIRDTTHFQIVDGNKVMGKNLDGYNNGMGAQSFPNGLTCTVTSYGYASVSITDRNQDIIQQANTSSPISAQKLRETGFEISFIPASLSSTGTQFSVWGTIHAVYRERYQWTSGTVTTGNEFNRDESVYPTTITCPDATNISNNTVTVPANTGTTEQEHDVYATHNSTYGNWQTSNSITHAAVAYSYDNPIVTIILDELGTEGGTAYHMVAGESTIYPTVHVKQIVRNSVTSEVVDTIEFNVPEKTNSGNYDGYDYTVNYYGGTGSDASKGGVYAASKGTTEDSGSTPTSVTSSFRAKVTINGKNTTSSYTTVRQQLNKKTTTEAHTIYSAISITGFKSGSTTIQKIQNCAQTNVTVVMKGTWTDVAVRYDYTSGAHTGGGETTHTNVTVTSPIYLTVNNSYVGATDAFSATNTHTLDEKTYSVYVRFGESTGNNYADATSSIDQVADSITENATKDYVIGSVTIGSGCAANGGTATISVSASHTKFNYWNSGGASDVVSGSETVVFDTASLSPTILSRPDPSSSDSVFWITDVSLNSRNGITTATLNHRHMHKLLASGQNYGIDSVRVTASNGSATPTTDTVSVTNTRSTTPREAGDWHDVGDKTYGTTTHVITDYVVSSFTASNYTSSSSAAPWKGITANGLLSWSASHTDTATTPWTQGQEGTVYYDYSSGDYDTETATRTVTGSDVVVTHPADLPVITSDQNWLSVTGANVTFAESSDSSVRYATLTANNNGATKTVTLYQRRSAAISYSPEEALVFTRLGGELSFTVNYKNTTFSITHSGQGTGDPIKSLSPSSGGSATSTSTRKITVTADPNSSDAARYGEIVITPGDAELTSPLYIDTMLEGAPPAGKYVAYADAQWGSSRINYSASVKNGGTTRTVFSGSYQVVYTTGSQTPEQGTSIKTKTYSGEVEAGATEEIVSDYVITTKVSTRTYWVRFSSNIFDSGWQQVEDSA